MTPDCCPFQQSGTVTVLFWCQRVLHVAEHVRNTGNKINKFDYWMSSIFSVTYTHVDQVYIPLPIEKKENLLSWHHQLQAV